MNVLNNPTSEVEDQCTKNNKETTFVLRTEKRKCINGKIKKAEKNRTKNNEKIFTKQ